MPLPMVHLAIAHELMNHIPKDYNKSEIYLGVLAPDAIHMRENFIRTFKYKTHLCYGREGNVIDKLLEAGPRRMNAFKLGYGIHVLTDIIWLYNVYYPFKKVLGDLSKEEIDLIYYGENDQLDFLLYHDSLWREEVFGLIKDAKAPNDFPFLSDNEIEGWKHHILHWYDEGKSKHTGTINYLNKEAIQSFISDATQEIKNRLHEMI